jgi:hypothetical protein
VHCGTIDGPSIGKCALPTFSPAGVHVAPRSRPERRRPGINKHALRRRPSPLLGATSRPRQKHQAPPRSRRHHSQLLCSFRLLFCLRVSFPPLRIHEGKEEQSRRRMQSWMAASDGDSMKMQMLKTILVQDMHVASALPRGRTDATLERHPNGQCVAGRPAGDRDIRRMSTSTLDAPSDMSTPALQRGRWHSAFRRRLPLPTPSQQ